MRYGTVDDFSSASDEREDLWDSTVACWDTGCVNAGGLSEGDDTEDERQGDGDEEKCEEEGGEEQGEENEGGGEGQEDENGEGWEEDEEEGEEEYRKEDAEGVSYGSDSIVAGGNLFAEETN